MYMIVASIPHEKDGWHGVKHLPAFYLHEDIQGITATETAEAIARDIVDPLGQHPNLYVTALKVSWLTLPDGRRVTL